MSSHSDIDKLRSKIDALDRNILKLLNDRAKVVLEVGKIKKANNEEIFAPARERDLLERLDKANKGPLSACAVRAVFGEILSASRALQSPLKIAYLGPEATFTHLASLKFFGHSTELVPQSSIAKVFDEVENGRSEGGVVPIENSTEGVVGATLDRFIDSPLKIIAETALPISHHLLSQCDDLRSIQRIYSHPQATAQCRVWLEANLPSVPVIEVESTAKAAARAADDASSAGIAGEHAAEAYRLKVVRKNIEHNPENMTRFLVLGRKNPERTGVDKTSILFSVKDKVGILYRMLEPFNQEKINLTKIESRPLKRKAWQYIFFLDIDGHCEDKKVIRAIRKLEKNCFFLKILGSYPKYETSV